MLLRTREIGSKSARFLADIAMPGESSLVGNLGDGAHRQQRIGIREVVDDPGMGATLRVHPSLRCSARPLPRLNFARPSVASMWRACFGVLLGVKVHCNRRAEWVVP